MRMPPPLVTCKLPGHGHTPWLRFACVPVPQHPDPGPGVLPPPRIHMGYIYPGSWFPDQFHHCDKECPKTAGRRGLCCLLSQPHPGRVVEQFRGKTQEAPCKRGQFGKKKSAFQAQLHKTAPVTCRFGPKGPRKCHVWVNSGLEASHLFRAR